MVYTNRNPPAYVWLRGYKQGELDLANLVMRQLLNLEGTAPINIASPQESSLQPLSLPSAMSVYNYAKSNQPRVLAAQSSVMANEAALRVL